MDTSSGTYDLNHSLFPSFCIGEYHWTVLDLPININAW